MFWTFAIVDLEMTFEGLQNVISFFFNLIFPEQLQSFDVLHD